ncbi:hypothetical protein F4679DRAFT_590548 [Xylaria curta]|nr:hypothetical protein F4679DRAFT_590548 [Xylaria curta]
MSLEDEISLSAQRCWEPFAEISAQLEHERSSKYLVQEYQQRFEAWIVFLGVLADGRLSLDHRLRNGPEVKSLILQQLQVLNRNLKAASKLAKEMQQDEHTNDESLRISSTMKATFCGIESALDRLHRLGVAIRQASAGQLMSRIKPLADDKRVSSFEILAYSVISTLYPGANSQLLEHVSASLALKYQVFLYRQGRERRYRVFPSQLVMPHLRSANRQESQTDLDNPPGPKLDRRGAKGGQVQSSIISSTFDAREFNKQVFETQTAPETPLPPTMSIRTGSVNYPPPQAVSDDAKYAKCEWCLENHPASMFKTPSEWRRHVQKDWTPYVCISEQCANITPVPSFARSSEWERHMQVQHGDDWPRTIYKPLTWICDLDHPVTNETETPRFASDTELAKHIMKSHEGIDSDEIQIMARHNTVVLNRPADVCPFCCYTIEAEAKTKNATTDTSEVQKTQPDIKTVVRVLYYLYNIHDEPEESGDHSSKPPRTRQIDFHVAGHLNTFTMLMIRMISVPESGEDVENEESVVFSESSTVGDDKSDYQNWESSDDEDILSKMPPDLGDNRPSEARGSVQSYRPTEEYVHVPARPRPVRLEEASDDEEEENRGALEQHPILLPAEDYPNPERRFVVIPSDNGADDK